MKNTGDASGHNASLKSRQSPIRHRRKYASLLSLNKNYARRIDTLFKKAYEATEAIADDSTRHQCRIAVIQELDGNRSVFLSHEDDAWPPTRETLYRDFDFKFSTDFMTLSRVQSRSMAAPDDYASDRDHPSPHGTRCNSMPITATRGREEQLLDEAFMTDNENFTGPPSSPHLDQACGFDMDTSLGRPSTLLPPSPTPVSKRVDKPTDAQGTQSSTPGIIVMPLGHSEQATLDTVTIPPCPTSWLISPSAPAGFDKQTQFGTGSSQAVVDTSTPTSVLPSTEQISIGSVSHPSSDHPASLLSSSSNDLQPLFDRSGPHMEAGNENSNVCSTPPSARAPFPTPPSSIRRMGPSASSRNTKRHDTDQPVQKCSTRRAKSSSGLMERLNGSMKASLPSCIGGSKRSFATSSHYSGSRRSRR